MTSSRQRLLRWASAIMIVLGAGHLVVLVITSWEHIAAWVDRGLWAVVPFLGTAPTVESLQSAVTFWSGPGGLSAPLILLGFLVRHLGERGVPVPAWLGWGLATWCLLDGVLLGPSPFFAGIVPGVLVVLAAREPNRQSGGHDRDPV